MNTLMTLQAAQALDAADPLRALRDQFDIPPELTYLDGNSLGVLPRAARERVRETVDHEWGQGLIRSWNAAGWFDAPQRVGDQIAPLVGALPGELVACDSTSLNLYKVLFASILIAQKRHGTPANPLNHQELAEKRLVLSERSNFPTDLYIAQSLCKQQDLELRLVDAADIEAALTDEVAVLMLTHVNYRTGAMHDMAALTSKAHAVGALAVWDLAHSAGAVPVDLHASNADFAVGCGYKYLNGGPGAPAFVWAHPKHASSFEQPLAGWWGHAAPFAFTPDYEPAAGISRYLCGTQPVIAFAALECGVATVRAADPLGGMSALRSKSLALTDAFMACVDSFAADHGLSLATPRAHAQRGSQVSYSRAEGGYAIMQALIARGVIGDFRAGDAAQPDILRFGFTPLYTRFEDVWRAADHLKTVLQSGQWREARFNQRAAVT
jgi:kynureninase